MQVLVGYIVKYVMDWLAALAISFLKKESQKNKEKDAIQDQVDRLKDLSDRVKRGEDVDNKDIIDASDKLINHF